MRPEVIEGQWIVIDGINGISLFPGEYFGIWEACEEYGIQGICSVESVWGYAARLSMPGFLDCTDWIGVFKTSDAALDAINEMYEAD